MPGARRRWARARASSCISREAFLLFNNILLVVAAAVVFGGTLAPLIADTLGLGTLSVGTPYFKPSFLVPMLPLLALVSASASTRAGGAAAWASRARRMLGALAAGAGAGGWRWPIGVLRRHARADLGRRGARLLDHPVLAGRSARPPAPRADAAGEPARHDAGAHRARPVRARRHHRGVDTIERDVALAPRPDQRCSAATASAYDGGRERSTGPITTASAAT